MRLTALASSLALLVSCAPAEQQVEAPPALSVAALVGTWNTTSLLTGVEDTVRTQLVVQDDSTGSMILSADVTAPMRLAIVGDSLIGTSAEYASLLRPGSMVTLRVAGVLHGDMLMGNVTATYRTDAGEEVVAGTFESTRAPQ
jgi:hypothetical protein